MRNTCFSSEQSNLAYWPFVWRNCIPEYLPGTDTGAAEPTDRRICWNKTLKALLSAIGKERQFKIVTDDA